MALQTPAITVTDVTETQAKLYRISFRMVATDDTSGLPGLDRTYVAAYKHGNDVNAKVAEVIAAFQQMIDRYKNGVVVYESAALGTARAAIESGLVV